MLCNIFFMDIHCASNSLKTDCANKVIKTQEEIKVDVQIYLMLATYINCLTNELCKSVFPQSFKTLIRTFSIPL